MPDDVSTLRANRLFSRPLAAPGQRIARKVLRARRDGTLAIKLRRQVTNLLYVPAVSLARDLPLRSEKLDLSLDRGFADHRGTDVEVRCSDTGLVRLIEAFQAAEKARPAKCPKQLEVRGVWAEWLDLHYGPLQCALRGGDVGGLRTLLENLHREHMSAGTGGTRDDIKMAGPLAIVYYRTLWTQYRNELERVRRDWSDVESPVVGNPHGAWVDGRLVQVETLRHAHHATVLLELLTDRPPGRILEIGGGIGGQAYQFVKLGGHKVSKYTIVDLPEVACLAGYYLLSALGEDRVRLFDEDEPSRSPGPVVEILPHWSITEREPLSAELVFNAHSFSEMDSESAGFYLQHIERVARPFLFHINHETRFRYRTPDGRESVNRIGSEMVPTRELFQLVSIRPQTFVRPENRANRGFAYLYERRSTGPGRATGGASLSRTGSMGRGLRVLFLTSSSDRYGSDRALRDLTLSLSALGFDIAVSAPREGPLLESLHQMGIPTAVVPLCVVGRTIGAKELLRSVLASFRARPDVVGIHRWFRPHVICSNTSHVVEGPALAKALGARHVFHLREIERVPAWARTAYGRWLAAHADRVLPISASVQAAYFPAGSALSTVVPDGIDIGYYSGEVNRKSPHRYSCERPLRVLAIGRLTPWKGQDIAIAAVASLLTTEIPINLRVVGGALTEADRMFEQGLRSMAEPYRYAMSIEGEVEDVRPHYRWSDVVLHTSTQPEPFGRVIIEAMASGRAVIASRDGGPCEIIRHGVDGLLVTPGDVEALASELESLARSPSFVEQLSLAAQAKASVFSVEATANRVATVLSQLCGYPLVPALSVPESI